MCTAVEINHSNSCVKYCYSSTDLPEQLLNQLVSMTTNEVEEQPPREMTSDLSTLTPEDQERLEVIDDTFQQ